MVLEVDCESQRNHIIDIQVLFLAVGFHVEEKLILSCQGLVAIYMTHKLLESEFAQSLKIDPI